MEPSLQLFVKGLAKGASEGTLYAAFSLFGALRECQVRGGPCSACSAACIAVRSGWGRWLCSEAHRHKNSR